MAKKTLEVFEALVLKRLRLLNRLEYVFEIINKKDKEIFTYSSFRFQAPTETSKITYSFDSAEKALILIQGLVSPTKDFESKSIAHYLSLNPNQEILVSTWDDKASRDLQNDFRANKNVRFIFSELPDNSGPVNINLQITNTKNGLLHATEREYRFVVKIRTDQCMMHPRAIENLFTLHRFHNATGTSRMIANSLNTFLLRPYGASDMFQFGCTEDLLKYWSAPLDQRKENEYDLNIEGSSLRNIASRNFGETYLGSNLLRADGIIPNYSLSQSIDFILRYFIVVDNQVTNLVWNKYTHRANRWPHSLEPAPYQEIDYSLWLALENRRVNLDYLDALLDVPVQKRSFCYE
jgi:hypothetical protein